VFFLKKIEKFYPQFISLRVGVLRVNIILCIMLGCAALPPCPIVGGDWALPSEALIDERPALPSIKACLLQDGSLSLSASTWQTLAGRTLLFWLN
jgi:hypothetical protein